MLVIHPAARPAIEVESGSDGRFRVSLAPGTYTIRPRNTTGALMPTAFPRAVTVRPGTWTTLTVEFDSGVR